MGCSVTPRALVVDRGAVRRSDAALGLIGVGRRVDVRDDAGGIAADDRVGRHVLGNHGSGPDDRRLPITTPGATVAFAPTDANRRMTIAGRSRASSPSASSPSTAPAPTTTPDSAWTRPRSCAPDRMTTSSSSVIRPSSCTCPCRTQLSPTSTSAVARANACTLLPKPRLRPSKSALASTCFVIGRRYTRTYPAHDNPVAVKRLLISETGGRSRATSLHLCARRRSRTTSSGSLPTRTSSRCPMPTSRTSSPEPMIRHSSPCFPGRPGNRRTTHPLAARRRDQGAGRGQGAPAGAHVSAPDRDRRAHAWTSTRVTSGGEPQDVAVAESLSLDQPSDLTKAFQTLGDTIWIRLREGGGGAGSLPVSDPAFARIWIDHFDGWGKFTASELLAPESITWSSIWNRGELIVAQTRKRLYWLLGNRTLSGITGVTGAAATVRDQAIDEFADTRSTRDRRRAARHLTSI